MGSAKVLMLADELLRCCKFVLHCCKRVTCNIYYTELVTAVSTMPKLGESIAQSTDAQGETQTITYIDIYLFIIQLFKNVK